MVSINQLLAILSFPVNTFFRVLRKFYFWMLIILMFTVCVLLTFNLLIYMKRWASPALHVWTKLNNFILGCDNTELQLRKVRAGLSWMVWKLCSDKIRAGKKFHNWAGRRYVHFPSSQLSGTSVAHTLTIWPTLSNLYLAPQLIPAEGEGTMSEDVSLHPWSKIRPAFGFGLTFYQT